MLFNLHFNKSIIRIYCVLSVLLCIAGMPLETHQKFFNSIISNIRFLTMTLSEFVSSPYRSYLLTEEQKRSILLNIQKYGSAPLSDGLCVSNERRKNLAKG